MKRLLAIWICLVAAAAAGAEEPDGWIADANGCKFHNRFPKPGESVVWDGACKDGYGEGHGVLQWFTAGKAGSRYEGDYAHGTMRGRGNSISPSGALYEGAFQDGRPSGAGTMTWPNGDRYEGDWVDGKRTGRGTLTRVNGDRYEGDFVDGKWSGKGVFTSAHDGRYEGGWVDNKRQGQGRAVLPDGTTYVGEFQNDRPLHAGGAQGERYALKESTTASHIPVKRVSNIPVPPDKPYAELTDDQKRIVRAQCGIVSETDEPPYPLNGMREILEAAARLQRKYRVEGELHIAVTVDPSGKPLSVKAYRSPGDNMTQAMASVLMVEKYKPAVCGGAPCTQDFALRTSFTLSP